jgi:RNA-directed DNA polymerase
MKTQMLLENYDLPGDLEQQIGILADQYNNHRYHASLTTPTPADVCNGHGAKNLGMS